jgi:RNA polymerase sigma-70 factor (ECF subfamily)
MGADIPTGAVAGSPNDDELLAAARQGDAAALEALLVRYQPHLYRFGLRMCGNVEDAGDVAQESLISMARSLRDFRGDSSVSSWLYTIARRFCIKKRRRSKFAPAREESLDAQGTAAAQRLADPAPSPEQNATNRELAAALTRAIQKPPRSWASASTRSRVGCTARGSPSARSLRRCWAARRSSHRAARRVPTC